uniref:Fatty acid hydroxylase domain-containing protein n=1 Tax=Hemiselmis andersenii TaxID=464988 RepID=A0A6U4NGD9_HEMAN
MDLVLDWQDGMYFDAMYKALSPDNLALDRSNIYRQFISIYLTVGIGGVLLYTFFSGASWLFLFDHNYLKHPKILKNQVRREIVTTLSSIPFMTLLTTPVFLLEVRGYSKLTEGMDLTTSGVLSELFDIFKFLVFTDFCIYWIHRFLHHPILYGPIHKIHHLWKVPTPWASHAFHPLDGFAQSTPYHLYAFLFPINKVTYLLMFVFVNCWTISIHDGFFLSKEGVINSSAHHAEHHLHFTCNYGQYFTLWDRLFGTHRAPDFEKLDPQNAIKAKAQ